MKGRWVLLLAGAGAVAAVAGWAAGKGINAAADAIRLPPLSTDFPPALHRAILDQLATKYPGAQVSSRDLNRGYRWYGIKTLNGAEHQLIYQADGSLFSSK